MIDTGCPKTESTTCIKCLIFLAVHFIFMQKKNGAKMRPIYCSFGFFRSGLFYPKGSIRPFAGQKLVCRLVGWSVSRSVIISYNNGRQEVTPHAPPEHLLLDVLLSVSEEDNKKNSWDRKIELLWQSQMGRPTGQVFVRQKKNSSFDFDQCYWERMMIRMMMISRNNNTAVFLLLLYHKEFFNLSMYPCIPPSRRGP